MGSYNPKLTVINGDKGKQRRYVCTWCGESFERRFINSDGIFSLQEHQLKSKRCQNNQNVNNPTQEKYFVQQDPEPEDSGE